jgi:DNA-binding NarL/FixJ family response regulator
VDVTRVVLVDDDAMVRAGLRMVLSADPTIQVVAEAADGRQALATVAETAADVVLMDLQMPVLDGIAATRELRARGSTVPVLVLTTFQLDTYVVEALRVGAGGYLLKDTPPAEVARAVHLAAAGESVFSAPITERLVAQLDRPDDAATADARRRLDRLTDREREVADAVAAGSSNATIAADRHMSEATVKTHVSRILAKTGAENRVQIALLIYRTRPPSAG